MGELCRIIRHLGSTREPENFSHALFAFPFFYRRQDRELLGAIFRGLLDCPCRVQPPPIANSIQENVQQTTKRVIAREWLTFVVLLAVGLTIAPLVVITIAEKKVKLAMLPAFYEALFSRDDWVRAWLVALAPYIIYQLGRSLVWAVKTAKSRSAHNTFTKSDRVKIITASI